MTDSTLNRFLAYGTAAQRAAFTPSVPTPASGPSPAYIWYETDTGDTYAFAASGWHKIDTSVSAANPTATGSDVAVNGSAATFMRSDAAPAIQKTSSTLFGLAKVDNTTITASGGVISGTSGANPTATGSDTAINGSATTFMRSDASPAIQKTSASLFGLSKVDGATITASSGVISGAAAANPTATAGPTAVNGSATTFMRSDGAPAIQKGSNSVFGIVEVDNTTITASGGIITATGSSSTGSITGKSLANEILADVPTGYWKCNDTSGSTIVDSSGGGFNMTVVGTPTLAYSQQVPTQIDSYLRIKSATDGASITSVLGTSPPLGDCSFCCMITPETLITNHLTVFSLGLNSSESEANNIQFYLYFDVNNSFRPTAFWESGAGVDTNVNPATGTNQAPSLFQIAMWHVVRDSTAKTVTFWRNGVLIGTPVTYVNNPTGGTGSIQARIGYDGTLSTSLFRPSHVAFFNNVKLTAARVWAHAQAAGLAGYNV